jgi:serine/threonine-protein phosphatase 2B catalytic subunit
MSVTDMLIAILNCCTKEELEEEEETPMITPESPELEQEGKLCLHGCGRELMIDDEDNPERRQVIKNKILAVGRMSRVFALLR